MWFCFLSAFVTFIWTWTCPLNFHREPTDSLIYTIKCFISLLQKLNVHKIVKKTNVKLFSFSFLKTPKRFSFVFFRVKRCEMAKSSKSVAHVTISIRIRVSLFFFECVMRAFERGTGKNCILSIQVVKGFGFSFIAEPSNSGNNETMRENLSNEAISYIVIYSNVHTIDLFYFWPSHVTHWLRRLYL